MKEITDQTFPEFIKSAPVVVVDCYATWCGPCRVMLQTLSKLEEAMPDLPIAKLNVDDYAELSQQFGVRSIPTLLFFKDGKHVDTLNGAKFRVADLQAKVEAVRQ